MILHSFGSGRVGGLVREEGSHKANSVSCSWDEPLPQILRDVDQFARSELVCADVSPTDANSIVRRRGGRAPLVALFIQGAPKRAEKAKFLDSLTREILQSEHTCASGNSKRRETLTGWFWPCNSKNSVVNQFSLERSQFLLTFARTRLLREMHFVFVLGELAANRRGLCQ